MTQSPDAQPTVLMLTGPTGIGKTGLAVRLAERFPLELISADSMQVYRGMAIGTAQPSPAEQRRATFHLCGVLDPAEPFNVHRFLQLCDEAHHQILVRGNVPMYVGGTGLYLRALRWGLFDQASRDETIRAELNDALDSAGPERLHRRLSEIDPEAAARIAPADGVRIVRALEVYQTTGQPISALQRQWEDPSPRFPHRLVIIDAPRELVRRRIERRTDEMLAAGWVNEVRSLLEAGVPPASHCFKALGYREIIDHLAGHIDFETMRRLIVTRTHQFSKRQRIWFRRERDAEWMVMQSDDPLAELLPRLEKLLESERIPFL